MIRLVCTPALRARPTVCAPRRYLTHFSTSVLEPPTESPSTVTPEHTDDAKDDEDVDTVSSYIKGDPRRKKMIDEILRVDHAGEYGAVRIYDGQMAVLRGTSAYEVVKEMRLTEVEHLDGMNRLVAERRVRPTALMPLWHVMGFALGAGTAMLGEKAAMACTVAVETTIGNHYNDQIRDLLQEGYREDELLAILKKNRDEELDHLDTAVDHGAEQAPGYDLLSNIIKTGCSAAIWVTKRV